MRKLITGFALAACAMALSSCYYDPYYGGSASVGYSSYGYGGGSSSVFISTGSSQWGYSPYYNCYYDYHRRAYYDPYLYGYYPVGYLPPVVYGVPHPRGYRHGYCPPPSRVRYNTLSNYRYRASAYQRSHYDWGRRTRQTSEARRGSPPSNATRDFNRNSPRRDQGGNPFQQRQFDSRRDNSQGNRRFDSGNFTRPDSGRDRFSQPQRSNQTPIQYRQPSERQSRERSERDFQQRFQQQRERGAERARSEGGQRFQGRSSESPRSAPAVNRSSEGSSRGEGRRSGSSERSDRGRGPF